MNLGYGHKLRKLGYFVVGIGSSGAAFLLGGLVLGPLLRFTFGAPVDYNSDYTPRPAFQQAMCAHALALSVVFFALGAAHTYVGQGRERWALWAANPISFGLSYVIFRHALGGLLTPEYAGIIGWMLLSLFGPALALLMLRLGSMCRRFVSSRSTVA